MNDLKVSYMFARYAPSNADRHSGPFYRHLNKKVDRWYLRPASDSKHVRATRRDRPFYGRAP